VALLVHGQLVLEEDQRLLRQRHHQLLLITLSGQRWPVVVFSTRRLMPNVCPASTRPAACSRKSPARRSTSTRGRARRASRPAQLAPA
jgi:hypothetical protein